MRDRKQTNSDAGMLFEYLAAVILNVLYSVLSLLQFLNYVYYKLGHIVRYATCWRQSQGFKNFVNKPQHLAVVVADTPVSYNDLAKMIMWSYETGIYYVTLYDYNGLIKRSLERIVKAADVAAKGKARIIFHYSTPSGQRRVATRNNVQNEVHVHLAASEDGRRVLVDAAKQLHETQSEVTINKLDKMVRVTIDWPEPDLLIRCGGVHSHLGFPPWVLHLTEFADLYSHRYLLPSEFRDIIRKFSSIDRRRGR